jgi:hypothetical protein
VNALEIDWMLNSSRVLPASYTWPSAVAMTMPKRSVSAPAKAGMEELGSPPRTSRSCSTTCSRYSVTADGPKSPVSARACSSVLGWGTVGPPVGVGGVARNCPPL